MRRAILAIACLVAGATLVDAGTIDTSFIEQEWPKQLVREFEVGRHQIRWRQRGSRRDGIFAGVRFASRLPRAQVWALATNYRDVSPKIPGVAAMRFVEATPLRQVIEIEMHVLFRRFVLRFEVEQEPPSAIRFRLVNAALGEFRGMCLFADAAPGTAMELAIWIKPVRPLPIGFLLAAERMILLQGVRNFLDSCEQLSPDPAQPRLDSTGRVR